MRQTPKNHHLISQALLRRFADKSGQLASFNLEYGKVRLRSPAAVAYEIDFVAHEPAEAEDLWGEVENKLPLAFAAVDRGDLFDVPGAATTLKEAIALHFIRRRLTKEISAKIYATAPSKIAGLVVPPEFRAREKEFKARALSEFEAELDEVWAENVQSIFRQARERVAMSGLGLIWSEMPLLIGDGAVLSEKDGGIGFVAFAEAGTHLLPIGRHHLVALAPSDGTWSLPPGRANELNRSQAREAKKSVFYHPDEDFSDLLSEVRGEWLDG